jgi:ABC-2 type transport system ATP-binding protein
VLNVCSLRKAYGTVQVLRGVNFEAGTGRVRAFLGANGTGKTTMVRILARVLAPDAGEITWKGGQLARLRKSVIGYLPESNGFYPMDTVEEQLVYFATLRVHMSASGLRRRVRAIADRIGVANALNKLPRELSKGTVQKCQMISAFVHSPELLLLDEPFSGLDPIAMESVTDLIRQCAWEGAAILLSTHRVESLDVVADDLTILRNGEVAFSSSMQEVFAKPRQRVLRMSDFPSLEALAQRYCASYIKCNDGTVELTVPVNTDLKDVVASALAFDGISHIEVLRPKITDLYKSVAVEGAGAV